MGSNGEGTYAKVRGGSGHLASWAQELFKVPTKNAVRSLEFGLGNRLVVGCLSEVGVYTMPAGSMSCALSCEKRNENTAFLSVAFAPDGKTIATGSADGSASIWDAVTGSLKRDLIGHEGPVYGVAIAGDGKTATASADGTARIWNIASGECIASLDGHTGAVLGVDISRDGMLVGTASADRTAKIWSNGECVALLSGHTKPVRKVRFSKLTFLLATCSDDCTAKLWRLASRRNDPGVEQAECYLTLKGHTGPVYDIAFDKEASALASVSSDKTIQLWRTPDGHNLRKLTGQGSEVLSVAFSPSGSYIATGTRGGFKLWGIAPKGSKPGMFVLNQ
jgi:WD40 repeat protein